MEQNEEIRIDFGKLFSAIRKRSWQIALVAAVCAALAFLASRYIMTPQYTASAKFYITNRSGDGNPSVDLNTARDLVDSYIVILNTWETLDQVIDLAEVDYSIEAVQKMLSAGAVNNTEIFEVRVTCAQSRDAALIAQAITRVLPAQIESITGGLPPEIAESPRIPLTPSSISPPKVTLIGFLSGFALATGLVMMIELFRTHSHEEEKISQ